MKPLLFRFKIKCSKNNEISKLSYNEDEEILQINQNAKAYPAIHMESLGTKKENMEKGEDEGPSLIFNKI